MMRSQQQWQELISAQECSDLSITDFCRKHKISTTSFYGRRSALFKQASSSSLPDTAFVKVVIPPSSQPSEFAVLSVGSAELRFTKQPDTQWLASLMRQLA